MKTICTLALTAGLALSQEKIQEKIMIFDQQALPPGATANTTFNISFARSGEALVKGAPYSADSVTETVQVLADGNRITHSNKSSFARDTEGRTRRESTIQGLGPIGQTESPITSIFIDDPVAKTSYVLDSKSKIAFKTKTDPAAHKLMAEKMAKDMAVGEQHDIMIQRMPLPASADMRGTKLMIEAKRTAEFRTMSDKNVKTEDLGTRTIEGVQAKGSRTVMTIAAGEMGNERPIEVITENWYSDELKTNVLTRHSDPRNGETTTKLMNVRLANPSASLFEPPADFKVEEGPNMRMPAPASFRVREDR